jgi:hypothetical protein
LWDIGILGVIFQRLQGITETMPDEVWQTSVTLAWHVPKQEFVLSERTVTSEIPDLSVSLEFPGAKLSGKLSMARETFLYQRSTLKMAMKMRDMNPAGFYNYFASISVKNDARGFLALASVFFEEVLSIQKVAGLGVNIVYNPLTLETIQKMRTRGGNALGIEAEEGPLMSKSASSCPFSLLTFLVLNINLHWSETSDTQKMTQFMRRILERFAHTATQMGLLHRYIFQNHAFEEQDVFAGYGKINLRRLKSIRQDIDPDGIFQKLQPGYFKLGEYEQAQLQSEV